MLVYETTTSELLNTVAWPGRLRSLNKIGQYMSNSKVFYRVYTRLDHPGRAILISILEVLECNNILSITKHVMPKEIETHAPFGAKYEATYILFRY